MVLALAAGGAAHSGVFGLVAALCFSTTQPQSNTFRGVRSTIMRLGLIADIHADHRALESALRHLDQLAVSTILCAGDLVGYGTHADDVVALIRERSIPCVRGNHDRWALERRQVIGLRGWREAAFRPETWEFLAALPPSLRVVCGSRRIAVYHGSPAADTEYVTPYKPIPETIDRFWDQGDADVLVLGHSHIPMVERTATWHAPQPGIDPGCLRCPDLLQLRRRRARRAHCPLVRDPHRPRARAGPDLPRRI